VSDEIVQEATVLSKNKRKKLEQLAQRKEKEAKREQLYASLAQKNLAPDQLAHMHSSAKFGHKETLRERFKRSMLKQRAGLALSAEDEAELMIQVGDKSVDREAEAAEAAEEAQEEATAEDQETAAETTPNAKKKMQKTIEKQQQPPKSKSKSRSKSYNSHRKLHNNRQKQPKPTENQTKNKKKGNCSKCGAI
jgi:hypothetical protein